MMMWFFQIIIEIAFKRDYVLWRIIAMLKWIEFWTKLRINKVPPDQVRWSCLGFGYLWQAFVSATDTMTHNNKKYKWCTSYNNVNVIWGFHWKDGHDEWKHRQCKKSSVCFYNTANNAISPCSYLMTNSEYSTEESEKGGDNS